MGRKADQEKSRLSLVVVWRGALAVEHLGTSVGESGSWTDSSASELCHRGGIPKQAATAARWMPPSGLSSHK